MADVLCARGFGYSYPQATEPALRDVTLAIEAASFNVIVGESGSGKSTLLRAACGLVPHFHGGEAVGEFEVGGRSVRDHGPAEIAAVCGTVFQDPEAQVVMSGVRAEVSLPLEQRGASRAAVARAVEETALVLGIAHLLDRSVETLSGGELQRVAVAAAIAHRPALLVLDEPTSQLDPVAGDELIWLLRRLNEEWGTAVLIVEQRAERCLAAADRVIALDRGRIVSDSAPAEFLGWAADARPQLLTPAARLFSLAGLAPLPTSVKQARGRLAGAGLAPSAERPATHRRRLRPRRRPAAALELRGLWLEIPAGPAILRGLDLRVEAGERVALMGRNGAGKSTVLRCVKGLAEPTAGRVGCGGDVALLLQNPNDYLVHERVRDELEPDALAAADLDRYALSNPRDLSGGERQRLALEIVLAGRDAAVVCLDEPTRGMDRVHKAALKERIASLAAAGAAVLVATHDTEFAAEFADRVVLMGEGVVIADGSVAEVLAGGWYFATEVARILGGAGDALLPEQGAEIIARELVA